MDDYTEYDWAQEGSLKRKRKIDKDGFVCPATPDIPRSSVYYADQADAQYIPVERMASPGVQGMTGAMVEGMTAPMVEGMTAPAVEGMAAPVVEQYPESFPGEDVYGNTELEAMERTNVQDKIDEKGAAVLNSDLQTVIQGSRQNFCTLIDHWSDIFRRSAEIETLCTQKLDQYIQQASEVQEALNQQKTALYHRLTNIRNTLQVKSDQ